MLFKKEKLIKFSSYCALTLLLILFLFVISLKIFVPVLINYSLKSISNSKEVDISVKKAEFSLKDGLKIKNLKLRDKEKIPLKIEKFSIRPDYSSSLREKRLIFKNVDLGSTDLDASNGSIKTFMKLFKSENNKKQDYETKLHINNIDIERLSVEISKELKIDLDNIDIDWKNAGKNNQKFDLNGLISINEEKSSELSGKILVDGKVKSSEVSFNIDNIDRLFKSRYLKIPYELGASLTTNINYASDISTDGKIKFLSGQNDNIGEFTYDLLYEKNSDDLLIESTVFSLNNYMTLTADGSVKNLNDTKQFDISSQLTIEDLGKTNKWISPLDGSEIKGSLKIDEISLKGSQENNSLNIIAKGEIENGSFLKGDYGAENFELDFDFNRNFSKNENLLDLNFDANTLSLSLPGDSNTGLNKLFTKQQLSLNIYKEPSGNLKINGDNLYFKKIEHDYFTSEEGTIEDFSIIFKDAGNFILKGRLNGNSFNAKGFEVSDVKIDFNTERKNEETLTTGKLNLQNGNFKTFALDEYEGDFSQSGRLIKLKNSSLKSNHPNSAKAELVVIEIPENGKTDIKIDFNNVTLFELQEKIKSNINNAELIVNSETADIRGKVNAKNLSYQDQNFDNLRFDLNLISQKLKLKNIKSNFLKGALYGDISLNITKLPYDFSLNLNLSNPNIKTGDQYFPIKLLSTDFAGNIDNQIINATGSVKLEDLKISKDIYESKLSSNIKLNIDGETIYIEEGFINSESSKKINFSGEISNFVSDKRKIEVNFEEMELSTLKQVAYPFLPFEIQEGDLSGTIKPKIGIKKNDGNFEWLGKIKITNASLYTLISLTELSVSGINGVFTLDNKSFSKNPISAILGKDFKIDKVVYEKYLSKLEENKLKNSDDDYLKIEEINYSFLKIKNIEALFEMNTSKINLNYFKSDIYRGNIIGAGVINMAEKKYNISLVFDDLSLDGISDSIPSIKDYMTGRFNGMMWINDGKNLGNIDGLFSMWAIKSEKERLTIGRPLLEKIGATGRFFTGSSRSYDKGNISGYIKEGFMTFKELQITNSFLGYKDLKIRVDEKKNSISLKQMLSVIREIAKRASQGGIKLDFEK